LADDELLMSGWAAPGFGETPSLTRGLKLTAAGMKTGRVIERDR